MKDDKEQKNRERDNRDTLGKKWELAPFGYKVIDQSQGRLFDLQAEISGFAGLFKKIGQFDSENEGLYGVGISLETISRRLLKLSHKISMAIQIDDKK